MVEPDPSHAADAEAHADAAVDGALPEGLTGVAAVPILDGERALGVVLVRSAAAIHDAPQAIATAAAIGQLTGHLVEELRLRRRIAAGGSSPLPPAHAHAPSVAR